MRDAIGPDVEILLEMHGRFSPVQAVQIIKLLEPFGLGWAEEPVPPENLAALAKVRADVPGVTIATGLNGNEQVVVSAGPFLNPGQKVAPKRMALSAALQR